MRAFGLGIGPRSDGPPSLGLVCARVGWFHGGMAGERAHGSGTSCCGAVDSLLSGVEQPGGQAVVAGLRGDSGGWKCPCLALVLAGRQADAGCIWHGIFWAAPRGAGHGGQPVAQSPGVVLFGPTSS